MDKSSSEHYDEAERLIKEAARLSYPGNLVAAAQVHATLALARREHRNTDLLSAGPDTRPHKL